MRVLHVAESLASGVLEVVRVITERGLAAGHPQALAFGRRPETPADVGSALPAGVELHELAWGARRPRTEWAARAALRAIAASWQPHVVHLHSSFSGLVGTSALAGRVPVVYTPHSFPSELSGRSRPSRAAFRLLERRIVRRSDVVGAVSGSEAGTALRLGAREVVTIPNGIVELDRPPAGRAGGQLRVVAGGRIVGQRRPEACARILSAVSDLAEVAWIGGGGAERGATTAGYAALEAAGVPVSGWMPRERVLDELARATAYLHWTASDGLSLSILEAFASGTVVVASDIPPSRELLDPRQLAATEAEAVALLRRLLGDGALRTELLARQAERAPEFSATRMAESWIGLYRRLARADQ